MDLNVRAHMDELKRKCLETRERHPRLVNNAAVGILLVTIALAAGAVSFVHRLGEGLPDVNEMRRMSEMDQSTRVFDDKDQLAFSIFKEQRIDVPLADVSPNLTNAIRSIEDQRFYDHHGFDFRRMVAAALSNVRHNRRSQGGSTITQQLARQSFLTPNKSFHRKFQELILAARIERLYTKPRILELYLNKVYFGDGLYGVEAASRGYFGKHASELSVPEAALIAGLVKSPSSYAPTVSLTRAVSRRNIVLQAMLDTGAIDRAAWTRARATAPVLRDSLRSGEPHGQYFKEQVRQELVNRFGWQRVYQGGLKVYSTLDMPMQVAAESALADQIKSVEVRRTAWQLRRAAVRKATGIVATDAEPDDRLQAALVALEPATGSIRAMVGGRDFDDSHFNRAVQAHRQPGSAFKPFVYAAALEAGYTPSTIIDHLDDPIATAQGDYSPEDGHSSGSSMSLRTGLRTSSNRAAVRLLQNVGIARTVQYAKAMGVGDVPRVPSLALGSGEVTLQTMTAAYAAFANRGYVPKPQMIRRVEDRDGVVLYEAQPSSVRAISASTAYLMSSMLADVINAGTGSRARALGFTLPAGGKTGTTNDFNDAWFIGFTPKLVTGVWVGFDRPRTILPNGFAADVAVPAWARFMKAATRHDAPEWLTPPDGVTTARVCRVSGRLAGDGCDDVYTEFFAAGTEPRGYCDQHPARGIVAGLFDDVALPAAPRVVDPRQSSTVTGAAPDGEAVPPPVKAKRGFWSRVFGGGKENQPEDQEPPFPNKKIGG
jgi:1A family penicillin-binding protein